MAGKIFPGQYNTYVANHAATKGMLIDFARNPKTFKLAEYAQFVPVDRNNGLYAEITVESAGRVLSADGAETMWADGNDAPSFHGNMESFEFKGYRTVRYAEGFVIGQLAAEQAEWDIVAQHARYAMQRTLTKRTWHAAQLIQNASNYDASHTSAAASIPGVNGKLDVSTTALADIHKAFNYAADKIREDTLSAVQAEDLMVVMAPETARKLSATQEIREYLKQQSGSVKYVTGAGPGPLNLYYGLPETLYGYKVVVEDSVRVTNRKGATKATSSVWDSDKIAMVSRVGGLDGVEGAPSFSTVTVFLKEEATVEDKYDEDNRVHRGRVVDDFDVVLTAPVSGFLITDVLT